MNAWYELVPAPSKSLKLTVHAGDVIAATVTVTGHQVTMTLADDDDAQAGGHQVAPCVADRHQFGRVDRRGPVGVHRQLGLVPDAAAGGLRFDRLLDFAGAQTTSGMHKGAISNRSWASHHPDHAGPRRDRRFVGNSGLGGIAKPTSLFDSGGSFTVKYSTSVNPSFAAASADVLPGAVVSGGG